MQQHAAIVERLTQPPPPGTAEPRRSFSMGVFLFWSLLFPPLAAAYALHASRPPARAD